MFRGFFYEVPLHRVLFYWQLRFMAGATIGIVAYVASCEMQPLIKYPVLHKPRAFPQGIIDGVSSSKTYRKHSRK